MDVKLKQGVEPMTEAKARDIGGISQFVRRYGIQPANTWGGLVLQLDAICQIAVRTQAAEDAVRERDDEIAALKTELHNRSDDDHELADIHDDIRASCDMLNRQCADMPTLRDMFAMNATERNTGVNVHESGLEIETANAYKWADAMMKASGR
jgi:hypothetical protein